MWGSVDLTGKCSAEKVDMNYGGNPIDTYIISDFQSKASARLNGMDGWMEWEDIQLRGREG